MQLGGKLGRDATSLATRAAFPSCQVNLIQCLLP